MAIRMIKNKIIYNSMGDFIYSSYTKINFQLLATLIIPTAQLEKISNLSMNCQKI